MPKNSLAPQQARSRESLRKLLKATAEVLGQHGVDRGDQRPGCREGGETALEPAGLNVLDHSVNAVAGPSPRRTRVSQVHLMSLRLPICPGRGIGGVRVARYPEVSR